MSPPSELPELPPSKARSQSSGAKAPSSLTVLCGRGPRSPREAAAKASGPLQLLRHRAAPREPASSSAINPCSETGSGSPGVRARFTDVRSQGASAATLPTRQHHGPDPDVPATPLPCRGLKPTHSSSSGRFRCALMTTPSGAAPLPLRPLQPPSTTAASLVGAGGGRLPRARARAALGAAGGRADAALASQARGARGGAGRDVTDARRPRVAPARGVASAAGTGTAAAAPVCAAELGWPVRFVAGDAGRRRVAVRACGASSLLFLRL